MKSNLSGRVFFLFVTFAYRHSEDYIGFFNNCYTITKKKKTTWISTVALQWKKQESCIMATLSVVILLQNFKEQKRERKRDRNKGKEREFS